MDFKKYIPLFFKGMIMGAADVVPGVSGGTIAFITGIYQELIDSIKSVNHNAVKTLFTKGIVAAWKEINGTFLVVLLAGIATSILSLVRLIHYLLDNHAVLLWSFFFGLILASIIVIGRKISKWTIFTLLTFAVGVVVAYYISITTPAETPESTWFIFLCGMIAITAMILPGISGSFILLLLKKYEFITGALKDFDLKVIITFALGCGVGLISFSNLLSWMFKNYYNATIALLTGFMLGSLNVVWPWKNVLESRINSKGETVPFRYESVLPQNFEGENLVLFAIVSMVVGFVLIVLLESFNREENNLPNGNLPNGKLPFGKFKINL